MSLFSRLFHKKALKNENKKDFINIEDNASEHNYVSVYDRENRYQLMDNENVINDNRKAEKFESTLLDRINSTSSPICPYCKNSLPKWPLRKTKCKSCGQYIYIKSSYIIKDKKMPLTLEEKQKLEKYRNNFSYLKQLSKNLYGYGITRKLFLKERKKMDTKFSDMDVIWNLLNKLSIVEFNRLNLGIHSNIHRDMANILIEENKLSQALEELMYIAFLDINGSMNSSQALNKAFDTKTGFVAPAINDQISECKEKLNLNNAQLKEIFINICEKKCKFETPLSPEKAWNKILRTK